MQPSIDPKTVSDLVILAQQRALNISNGRLSDVSPGSPLTAIFEGVATIGGQVINSVNNLANTLEQNRINAFGITRNLGSQSVATIQVSLDALYPTSFLLPSGFPITFNGIPFITIADLTITAYTSSGNTIIQSINPGINTNVNQNAISFYQNLPKLGTIILLSNAKSGSDPESDINFKNKIYATVRRRDTLISEDDFSSAILDFLGNGSSALTIGKLKPDKITFANGYVGCFGLNADGSILSDAQTSQLQSYLNKKAAMASVSLWSFDSFAINLELIVGFVPGTSLDSLANLINTTITNYVKNLPSGQPILNKAIEYHLQAIPGVYEGVVSCLINGFAQPQPLPNLWTTPNLTTTKITLSTTDGTNQTYIYNF